MSSEPTTTGRLDGNVFINCPYDGKYAPIMDAIVFAVVDCGFFARCALEIHDGTQTRFNKLCDLIRNCPFGIHDISRIELDENSGFPRFNMLFELGLFVGAAQFGVGQVAGKKALILDSEGRRYRAFVSDLAGQDIADHGNDAKRAIQRVREFLRAQIAEHLPGGDYIYARYSRYLAALPAILGELHLTESELTFPDRVAIMVEWLRQTAVPS